LAAAGHELDAVGADPAREHRRVERDLRAGGLGVAAQRGHQRVAVDDPRRRGEEPAHAGDLRLERADLVPREQDQVDDAVRLGVRLQPPERRDLLLGGGDDELADASVGDAPLGTIAVQRKLPLHARAGLQRAGRIVDAGVDHFGVPRAGVDADGPLGLQQHHFAPASRERPRHTQPDHSRADDGDVRPLGHESTRVLRGLE
jgi:hypothetical protein